MTELKKSGLRATDFTRAQRFLKAFTDKFPKQTQDDLANGKIRFVDTDLMHACNITASGGIYDLLRTNNDKQVGVSDLDSNKLEPGVNIAVDRIKLSYATILTASVIATTISDLDYNSNFAGVPTELKRAKLVIKQEGKTLLRLPVERFLVAAASPKSQGEEDCLILGTPIVLIEQKPLLIQLEFNPSKNMVVNTFSHFLQVRFMGTETASR